MPDPIPTNPEEFDDWTDANGVLHVFFQGAWDPPIGAPAVPPVPDQETVDIADPPDWWGQTGIPWESMFDVSGEFPVLRSPSAYLALLRYFNPQDPVALGPEPDWWAQTGIPWSAAFDPQTGQPNSTFLAMSKQFNPAFQAPPSTRPEFAYTTEGVGVGGAANQGKIHTWVKTPSGWKDITESMPSTMTRETLADGRIILRWGENTRVLDPLPLDAPRVPTSYEELITRALANGDYEMAQALWDFRQQPTKLELFDRALQLAQLKMEYAKSPLDYIVLSKMRRGLEVTAAERGLRAIENIDQWFDQVFPDLALQDVGLDRASVEQQVAEESFDAGVADATAKVEAEKAQERAFQTAGARPPSQEREPGAYRFGQQPPPPFSQQVGVGAMTGQATGVPQGAVPAIYSGGAPMLFQDASRTTPQPLQPTFAAASLQPGAAQYRGVVSSSTPVRAAPGYGNRETPYLFGQGRPPVQAPTPEFAQAPPLVDAGLVPTAGQYLASGQNVFSPTFNPNQYYQQAARAQSAPVRGATRYPGSDIPAVSQFFFQDRPIAQAKPIGPQVGLPMLRDVGQFGRLSPTEQELAVGEFQSRGLSGAELERDLLTHTIGADGQRRPFTFRPRRRR